MKRIIWYIHKSQQRTASDDPEAPGILSPLFTGSCILNHDLYFIFKLKKFKKVCSIITIFMSNSFPVHTMYPCRFLWRKNGTLYIFISRKILLQTTLKIIILLKPNRWSVRSSTCLSIYRSQKYLCYTINVNRWQF